MSNRPRLQTIKPRIATIDTRTVKPLTKTEGTVNPLYTSREWRELVGRLIAQRGRRCERCGRTHDENGRPVRIFGDHIIEVNDGGPELDPNNVQLLDGRCHTSKTNAARANRATQTFEESSL